MCGVVGVVSRRATRRPPSAADVLAAFDSAVALLDQRGLDDPDRLLLAARGLGVVDAMLRGVPGVTALLRQPGLAPAIKTRLADVELAIAAVDVRLARQDDAESCPLNEDLLAAVGALRDVWWALGHDRLRTAAAVADLAGPAAGEAAVDAFTAVQIALSGLDRLEVRGRDSAGLHLLVRHHGLDLDDPLIAATLEARADPRFTSGAVRRAGEVLAFTYKAAAEIGELGDNTRALRAALRCDMLLRQALRAPDARITVLGHTRWASVGVVSEANAHPVNSDELDVLSGPYVAAALNGDVDNFVELRASHGLSIHPDITTDAKVIPTIVARSVVDVGLHEAFRRSVASFVGSVAVAAVSAAEPDQLLLAVRGSGQGLYVGLADDTFVVASEPYGLVEEAAAYLRLDGETPARPEQPSSSQGQVVVLDGGAAGTLAGVTRLAYDRTPLPVTGDDLRYAEITTRDIDRADAPHFLLKEISEAPASFAKTLRGRVREVNGQLRVQLGDASLPPHVVAGLTAGTIRRVTVIGQGTAAVAGRALASVLTNLLEDSNVLVEAMTATELSGFHLRGDLSDSLVVAVSQSGTTTDTNRTVDLARERGAAVIAIVNRRNSDLVAKSDGVLYTSDGRDVEMSVASTKAFYAQVAAGILLACAIAERVDPDGHGRRHQLLAALQDVPAALANVLTRRDAIGDVARALATSRRHWAVVGNGVNAIAAHEVRIKLSELCYKSIACDVTEDKKHIDLSSEPLILVCAAGLSGSNVDDVAKEVAIYGAHRAAPIVIATDGVARFADHGPVLWVPETDPRLAFLLSAMTGHLFGYEAALAIDALADPLRRARAAVVDAAARPSGAAALHFPELASLFAAVEDGLRAGAYDGCLEASTAIRLTTVARFASGVLPLDFYTAMDGKDASPDVVTEDLIGALTKAINELTRPIDAIKHQAKTVTVGISRSDEGLVANRLVAEVLAAGTGRDRLSYRTLKTIADLEPAVAAVLGSTRYRIAGEVELDDATLEVLDRTGVALELESRVESHPELRGTKRRVAIDREPLVARGGVDGRLVLLVPELKGSVVVGITLLHVRLVDRLTPAVARGVLQGYRGRYDALRDWVTETELTFREERLAEVPVIDLLTAPVTTLADGWR